MPHPYLSVVMASRNDNYQGASFKRLEMAFNNLVEQAKRYNLRLEIIFVDWNPPEGKPLLKDALQMPKDMGSVKVRFIVVPNRVHRSYNPSERINIIMPAAWNIGIRRAEGEFILPTNADILFSDEIIQFLASENLRKDCFYRAFKYKVELDILHRRSLEGKLDFWKKSIPQADLEKRENSPHGMKKYPVLLTSCGADFLVFPKEKWNLVHGYPELNHLAIAADELICYVAYLSGLREEVLKDPLRVYHIEHESRWHTLGQSAVYKFFNKKIFSKLDPNDKWRILARSIYKIESKITGFFMNFYYIFFGSFLEKHISPEKANFDIKYFNWKYKRILKEMLKGRRFYVYNNDYWGFPEEKFEEFSF